MDDEARKRILARRAGFVAAAMTAMATEQGCASPQPCLSQPQPCLSVQPHPVDDAGADGAEEQPLVPEPKPEPEGDFAKPPPGEVAE